MKKADYNIVEKKGIRELETSSGTYNTVYSKELIEAIIKRKGIHRTPAYLYHKQERQQFLNPLFKYLKSQGCSNLRVLEVGCSAGQVTELLQEQDFISEIYSFDVDKELVEIAQLKVKELGLNKVKEIKHLSIKQSLDLPYQNNFFDIVIVPAVVEHLPVEGRFLFVDEYYRKLKVGGYISFTDTPNRRFFFEGHSFGLPFLHRLSPQKAFVYGRITGKMKNITPEMMVKAGVGWKNSDYYELFPKHLSVDIKDISEESGYGYSFFIKKIKGIKKIVLLPYLLWIKFISGIIGFPPSFKLPELNVLFKKTKDYE